MNKDALNKVIPRLHIQQVYISSSSLKVSDDFFPGAEEEATSSQFAWGTKGIKVHELEGVGGNKIQLAKMRFGAKTRIVKNPDQVTFPEGYKPQADEILAEIDVTFVAEYLVAGEGDLDQEGLSEFAVHNMPFHVWPYWREYLQSTATRAILPIPMLPFYQIKQPNGKSEDEK